MNDGPMSGSERERRRSKLTPAARRLGGVSLAEIFSRAVGFVALPFITRALGPAQFGSLSYVVAITSWVGVLSAPGLYAYGLREVAQEPGRVRRTTGEMLIVSFSLTTVAYAGVLAYTLLAHMSPTERTLFLLTGATLPVSSISISWAFIGMSRAGAVSTLTLATNVMYVGLVIWMVKEPKDVVLVSAFQLLQFTLIAAGLLLLAHRLWGKLEFRLSRARATSILREAFPLGLGTVMTMIYNRVDIIMLTAMKGRAEAGLYGGAYRLMEVTVLLPLTLLSIAILPAITGAFGRDPEEAARMVESYFRHFLVLAVPVAVGGVLLREDIVTTVLGREYLPSADVFGVLSINLLIGGTAALFAGCILVGLRLSATYVAALATGAAANVVLNLVFIPRFGMIAAAGATLVAQAAVATFAFVKVRESTGAGTMWLRYFPRPIFAGAVMAVPILLLRNVSGGLWLAGSVGSLTYALAIIVVRGADLSLIMRRG
jgi:O-antigen/teichoic acid export membrane protein